MPRTVPPVNKAEAMERNAVVRIMLAKSGIKYYQLAAALGVHYSSLNHWMREGLREDRYERILAALRDMTGGVVDV